MRHTPSLPLTRDLVLIGGGHTHALVLRRWAMDPLPGARLTVINPGPTAPYSGMLPGFVAGHYRRAQLDIDLVRLARFAGARLVLGAADHIDLDERCIHVGGRPPIGFDVASIDIGVTSAMPGLAGFAAHGVPAKPLGPFATAWDRFRDADGPAAAAVIGGGVAGVELAMAMAHALRDRGRPARVTLVERDRILRSLPIRSASRLRAALSRAGVEVIEGAGVAAISAEGLDLDDGHRIDADFVTGAAGARPQPWLAECGLVLHEGFVVTDARLRSSDRAIFAVGDCAHFAPAPRPKAGVFAVRQAPVLHDNLRAALSGAGGMRRYGPQRDYLKLISLGGKSAMADRFGFAVEGRPLWLWKDRIDRGFMRQFRDLPRPDAPPLPWPRAQGVTETLGPRPMCGGCGAKIGQGALAAALATLPAPRRSDLTALPGDDAALLSTGGALQVFSTDHLRAMVEDPVTMARIAAHHALGDIWAMGADPQAATASVVLPRLSDPLARRTLREIMQAAAEVMRAAGAEIVGGHSSLGEELTIGFALTGLCERAPITLTGARPGDALVLTKPLGSGVIMAAEMSGEAPGEVVAAALSEMTRSQAGPARALRDARAMTDVTGFGLAGHLSNLVARSGVGAEVTLDAVPLLPGALDLARSGLRSTLFAANRAALPGQPEDPRTDLLFDPQTAGGLLAAVSGDAEALVAALRADGHGAAIIGRISDQTGMLSIR